jgi:CheY-like chemotaxis protein
MAIWTAVPALETKAAEELAEVSPSATGAPSRVQANSGYRLFGLSFRYGIRSADGLHYGQVRRNTMPAPVVVVHNETDTRELAVIALQAAGHEVADFTDPMQALNAVRASGRARVLVTRIDFGPGQLNGVALAQMVRAKQRSIRALFIGRPENQHHTEGVGQFLPVPLDPQALVDAADRLLSARP